ncbi:MAG: ribonuclease H-like domain-containing protein, partial [Patescibacteria group bacterium]
IETQNFFTDPGVGRDNFTALRISVVGVYSYAHDKYFCFSETEIPEAAELFRVATRLVGFSINRYDVPVLNTYFQKLGPLSINLWNKDRVDLLEEIEALTGERISLSRLAEANGGKPKDHHGSEAISLYREGRIEELKAYCLNDVKITKDVYDIYKKEGSLLVPDKKTGNIAKIAFAKKHPTLL